MENPELANSSAKVDKKKKTKYQEPFVPPEHDVKPRRSFWRNLFRRQPKKTEKTEVPELTPEEKTSEATTARMNSIFEDSNISDNRQQVNEEIKDIKKKLQKVSQSDASPPSQLMAGITSVNENQLPEDPSTQTPKDDVLLDYLCDVSSSEDDEEEEMEKKPKLPTSQVDETAPSLAPQPKDGYSFEYSETSDASGEDMTDDKPNEKVKFDEKVEAKDVDSNIIMHELQSEFDTKLDEAKIDTEIDAETETETETGTDAAFITEVFDQETTTDLPIIQMSTALPVSSSTEQSKWLVPATSESLEELEVWNEKLNELAVKQLDETKTLKTLFPLAVVTTNEILYHQILVAPEEKQKVTRKRKMMSLINAKSTMESCLKQIELEFTQPTTSLSISLSLNAPKTLFLLEHTKNKLEKFLYKKHQTENYLKVFHCNIIEDEDQTSSSRSSSSSSCPLRKDDVDALIADMLAGTAAIKQSCIEAQESLECAGPPQQITSNEFARDILDGLLDRVFHSDKTEERIQKEQKSRSVVLLGQASDVVHYIEKSIKQQVERSKKFGPYYDQKPIESKIVGRVDGPPSGTTEVDALPNVSDSLQKIFFGEQDSQMEMASDFNLVDSEPLAGTSQPLLTRQMSISSTMTLKSLSRSSHRFSLTRKTPEINLHTVEPKEQDITDELNRFNEQMEKIYEINQRTEEMLNDSQMMLSPEGGSISIISTISANLPSYRNSNERYPQFYTSETSKPSTPKSD